MQEAEAIEKAKGGDASGYQTLYQLHQRRIHSLCLRITRDTSDAEDLVQEMFLQVHRNIGLSR
jgi:RNA polymerase sigma-70 factor (ECF subfamily)